eukprot:g32854.t1
MLNLGREFWRVRGRADETRDFEQLLCRVRELLEAQTKKDGIYALTPKVKAGRCPKKGHELVPLGSHQQKREWCCDGVNEIGGCLSGIKWGDFDTTKGMNCFCCKQCGFDYCEKCYIRCVKAKVCSKGHVMVALGGAQDLPNWTCDGCGQKHEGSVDRHCCKQCNYNLCDPCNEVQGNMSLLLEMWNNLPDDGMPKLEGQKKSQNQFQLYWNSEGSQPLLKVMAELYSLHIETAIWQDKDLLMLGSVANKALNAGLQKLCDHPLDKIREVAQEVIQKKFDEANRKAKELAAQRSSSDAADLPQAYDKELQETFEQLQGVHAWALQKASLDTMMPSVGGKISASTLFPVAMPDAGKQRPAMNRLKKSFPQLRRLFLLQLLLPKLKKLQFHGFKRYESSPCRGWAKRKPAACLWNAVEALLQRLLEGVHEGEDFHLDRMVVLSSCADRVHSFSSLFYTRLSEGGWPQVKTWTKSLRQKELAGIFAKEVLFVPAHDSTTEHWWLALVICPWAACPAPGGCPALRQPFVAFLDSIDPRLSSCEVDSENLQVLLQAAAAADLRHQTALKLLRDLGGALSGAEGRWGIWMDMDGLLRHRDGRPVAVGACSGEHAALQEYLKKEWLDCFGEGAEEYCEESIQGISIEVPQQTNSTDCGIYVLEYARRLLDDPRLLEHLCTYQEWWRLGGIRSTGAPALHNGGLGGFTGAREKDAAFGRLPWVSHVFVCPSRFISLMFEAAPAQLTLVPSGSAASLRKRWRKLGERLMADAIPRRRSIPTPARSAAASATRTRLQESFKESLALLDRASGIAARACADRVLCFDSRFYGHLVKGELEKAHAISAECRKERAEGIFGRNLILVPCHDTESCHIWLALIVQPWAAVALNLGDDQPFIALLDLAPCQASSKEHHAGSWKLLKDSARVDGWMDGDVVPVCSNVDVFTGHWWPVRGESLWQDYLMREWDECFGLTADYRAERVRELLLRTPEGRAAPRPAMERVSMEVDLEANAANERLVEPASCSELVVFGMGNNSDGQLGCGFLDDDDDKIFEPCELKAFDSIQSVAAGNGFTVLAGKLDGRLMGVGRGDRGQLGMGGADRDDKERVKFSSASGEQLLQISAGESHCLALCRSGKVLAFGENKHGQLGSGDFVVASLSSRPIVRVCCGAQHALARTATGLLWAWGCNEHGQLGLGDLKPRFRPEQVKALRVSRCVDVAAGQRHSLALSEKGLVLAFGAGGSGQLGSGGIAETEPYPKVVEVLKEVGICLQVACGHSHSLALVQNEESLKESVYSWGLGSSGQLGLPKSQLQEQLKISPLPQKLKLDPSYRVISLMSGPLAHHSFLIVTRTSNGFANGYPKAHMQSPRMLGSAHVYREASQQVSLVKAIGAAFSSVSVLNASFRLSATDTGRISTTSAESSGVDLLKVRKAYNTLVFELNNAELVNTLGRRGKFVVLKPPAAPLPPRSLRATLSICDELSKHKVPSDDPETLCVFLVLFENPLLLAEHRTSLFAGFHVALQKLTAAVLSLPKEHREWEHLGDLGGLECERLDTGYFGRVVTVMQQYVTYVLTQPGQNQSDVSAAVMMLKTLWDVNAEMGGILPEWCFQSWAISQSADLQEHYRQWQQEQLLVFSYCRYPFLLNAGAKRRLLAFDVELRSQICSQEIWAKLMRREGAQAAAVEMHFQQLLVYRVRRERLWLVEWHWTVGFVLEMGRRAEPKSSVSSKSLV